MVAAEDGAPAGFVLARVNAGEAEILSVGVRLSSRRRSLATALVQSALNQASADGAVEVFLEVAVENAAARALYRRLGFREVGLRAVYYREGMGAGSDALILRRALSG
jgi:ribosomal-protein-alanine N-acetyltransferase